MMKALELWVAQRLGPRGIQDVKRMLSGLVIVALI